MRRRSDSSPVMAGNTAPVENPARWLRGIALDLLARREHSVQELREKLLSKTGEDHASLVPDVINALENERLVSDERFAAVFVRYRAGKGYGPQVIRQELRQRGVMAELVAEAIESGEQDWFELARQACRKRFGSRPPKDWPETAKRLRFLQYRGFSGEQARQATGADACSDDD